MATAAIALAYVFNVAFSFLVATVVVAGEGPAKGLSYIALGFGGTNLVCLILSLVFMAKGRSFAGLIVGLLACPIAVLVTVGAILATELLKFAG
jgi:hypothetical protein